MSPFDIFGAAVNLVGSAGNTISQLDYNKKYINGVKDTNATNIALQREANANNLAMMREQNAFNHAEALRSEEYNTPSMQRARLLRAGINPASMVSPGSSSPVQSVAGSPAQAAHVVAPAPLQSPFGSLLGLGSDFLSSLQSSEAAKQAKMQTIRDGIDTYTYFDRKLLQLSKEYAELRNLGNLNEEQKLRLADLPDEIRHLQSMRDKASRNVDAEYDNLIKTGRKLDAESNSLEAGTVRMDKETAARIASMKADTAVKWYEAKTARLRHESQSAVDASNIDLTREQAKQCVAITGKLKQELRLAKSTEQAEIALRNIAVSIAHQDLNVRTYAARMAFIQLQAQKSMSDSEIKQVINSVFGIDVGTFFHSVSLPK